MYKFICVGFLFFAAVVRFVCTAKFALAVYENVIYAAETDVALRGIEMRNGILPVRIFGAVKTSAGEQTCKLRNCDPVKLFMENVVDTLLQIGNFIAKPYHQRIYGGADMRISARAL